MRASSSVATIFPSSSHEQSAIGWSSASAERASRAIIPPSAGITCPSAGCMIVAVG